MKAFLSLNLQVDRNMARIAVTIPVRTHKGVIYIDVHDLRGGGVKYQGS